MTRGGPGARKASLSRLPGRNRPPQLRSCLGALWGREEGPDPPDQVLVLLPLWLDVRGP